MRFEVGDKLRIVNAKELDCYKFWKNGTIVEIFAIDYVDGTLFIHNPDDYNSVAHEIYFDEYGFVELIKNKGSGSMKFNSNDHVNYNKKMDKFDKNLMELRIDFLLEHGKLDELKELTDELNKRSEDNE